MKRERILGVDDLAALPRGRAILLATGVRAALLGTVPWYHGPHPAADRIRASITAHDLSLSTRRCNSAIEVPRYFPDAASAGQTTVTSNDSTEPRAHE